MSYSGMFSTARARKVELKNTTIVEPLHVSEDVMDLEAPDRISLQDLGRSEREKNRRLAFLYE